MILFINFRVVAAMEVVMVADMAVAMEVVDTEDHPKSLR